jgi:hypothetical protein
MTHGDILDDFDRQRAAPKYPVVAAVAGLVVEHRASGFCGDVVAVDAEGVQLRDRHDRRRLFAFAPGGFLVDGTPVTLVRPAVPRPSKPSVSASGSIVERGRPAVTARASRIWVEGRHDAELLEHVWGDDLRELGIVVEPMHGIDELPRMVADFAPGRHRRLGVLVDHLVAGSKEQRLATQVAGPHVLVTGHPFVDVWEGIWPRVLGLQQWPAVPRGLPYKQGLCAALGEDLTGFWPRLRNRVSSFADLRPELVGAVERLIDFVASPVDEASAASPP